MTYGLEPHPKRMTLLGSPAQVKGPVLYWMSRDQRLQDNWALIQAQELASRHKSPLVIAFCLLPGYLEAGRRQFKFMLQGLRQVALQAAGLSIPFVLFSGKDSAARLLDFCRGHKFSSLILDFDPLRWKRSWQKEIIEHWPGGCLEVDAHNIVPCRVASTKQEFSARTIRPKIWRQLPEFLEPFPRLGPHPFPWSGPWPPEPDWDLALSRVQAPARAPKVVLPAGPSAALDQARAFLATHLVGYADRRNDPNAQVTSKLSPYLHFGQLAAQRLATMVIEDRLIATKDREAFLEELIVRRGLAENFCYYCPDYDRFAGLPSWGQATLEDHRLDRRDFVYQFLDWERARTHDPLWNAAQQELIQSGQMHGYLRMYWAKKILEWSASPEEALSTAIFLNDRYELDGRDPNGYTGVLWSIGGLHDRPWRERPVYGKVRYMNLNGARRKFDVQRYIQRWTGSEPG